MEFAHRVRGELARAMPKRRCCQQAELAAFVHFLGEPGAEGTKVAATDAATARKIFRLAKEVGGEAPRFSQGTGRRQRYVVHMPPLSGDDDDVYARDCCGRAYLRGAWLSRGSLSDPETGYHLEFSAENERSAATVQRLLTRYEVRSGLARRKSSYVVYIKEADGIAEVLRLTEAHGALLELEDFRVLKDMRNRINRLVNAETSNMEKTITAALRQVEDIRLIDEVQGLGRLSPSLREMAYVRLSYPDASLRDLGQKFNPPLSKSAVNHRLRRLSRLAEQMRRNPQPHSGSNRRPDG